MVNVDEKRAELRREKKTKLFNMIMEAQIGCSPIQFSINDIYQENVSASIYEAPAFAFIRLCRACDKEPGFARIEVHHGAVMIICW